MTQGHMKRSKGAPTWHLSFLNAKGYLDFVTVAKTQWCFYCSNLLSTEEYLGGLWNGSDGGLQGGRGQVVIRLLKECGFSMIKYTAQAYSVSHFDQYLSLSTSYPGKWGE